MFEIDVANLFASDETTTVFLVPKSPAHPQGVWVTFKRHLTYGEKCDVEAALVKGLARDEAEQLAREAEARGRRGGSSTILVNTSLQKQVRLATWIVDWNFPDRTGKTVRWPASPAERLQVVASLTEQVGEWLAEQIEQLSAASDAVASADPDDDGPDPLERSLVAASPAHGSP